MTEAICRAIQQSQASLKTLSKRYRINPKTVAGQRTAPKVPGSTEQ